MRAWYIGCAPGFQPGEEISSISARSRKSASVAYWLGIGSPVRPTEFDSPHSLHKRLTSAGVAQAEERRTRNAEGGVSNTPSGSKDVQKFPGESSNGRTAGLQPANERSIRSSSTNSPGRPSRSRHRSEKPDKHVRLVLLAPSVAVAEWCRRLAVNQSTRVRFSPVTPCGSSSRDRTPRS